MYTKYASVLVFLISTLLQLAASVPKRVVGKRHLRIETLGDVLEGEFDVVEVTARGGNIASTFTFQAVSVDELSGVFERVEPECYQALQEVVGGCPILADLAGPGADDLVLCSEKIAMIPLLQE